MIIVKNGQKKYFDRNGKEITQGCKVKYIHADKSMIRIVRVYRTINDELGTDATNPKWIESGRAVPCEYGVYPFGREETEMVEVVE